MNSLREFGTWRPDVEPLDDTTADRIWLEIIGDADPFNNDDWATFDLDVDETGPGVEISAEHDAAEPSRRRGPLVAAAVVAAIGLAGITALDFGDDDPTPAVSDTELTVSLIATTTSPEQAAQPRVEPAPEWEAFPAMPIEPRFQEAAVSTGDGLFVWGGCCADGVQAPFTDGAYFDGSEWRVLPEAPLDPTRGDAVVAWTGSEVVVLNGVEGVTAAAFNPATFTWRSLTAPVADAANNAGTRLFRIDDERLAFVGDAKVHLYDLATDTWSPPTVAVGLDGGTDDVSIAGYGISGAVVALVSYTGVDSCGVAQFAAYDTSTGSWWGHAIHTENFAASDLAGLPDGRFLVLGHTCGADPTAATGVALAIDPVTGTETRLADPPNVLLGVRYGPLTIDDTVVFLGVHHSALLGYRLADDEWTLGAPLVRTTSEFVDDTPMMAWGDDRIVLVSPGYGQEQGDGAYWCCESRPEAWVNVLPNVPYVDQAATPANASNDTTNSAVPTSTPLASSPSGADGSILFANASQINGVATLHTRTFELLGYDVLPPVNAAAAVGTLDQSVVYARSGYETLRDDIAQQLGISELATLVPGVPLPIDGYDNGHDDAAVLVMIGQDIALDPELGALSASTAGSVTIVDASDDPALAQHLADELGRNDIAVDLVTTATTKFDETMLMPIGDANIWTIRLADLLGIGGYDTWSSDLATEPIPDTTTAVILLGTDAAEFIDHLNETTTTTTTTTTLPASTTPDR